MLNVCLEQAPGACRMVWNAGFELHVSRKASVESKPDDARATVDLGQIHQAAVTTSTGKALVVSGRGIRSENAYATKLLGS